MDRTEIKSHSDSSEGPTSRAKAFGRWLRGHEAVVLVSLLVMLLCMWGFIEIADEVMEGDTRNFDEWVMTSLRSPADSNVPIGPDWLKSAATDITALGGKYVIVLICGLVVVYLLIMRRFHSVALIVVATGGGAVFSQVLKTIFERERPSLVGHFTHFGGASFPSGHAMVSAVVYLTLGTLMARLVAERWGKWYFLGAALIITLLVGITRVYLGVHYPTDVLAGWCAGLAWALLCWNVARALQRRGAVEAPVHVTEEDEAIPL